MKKTAISIFFATMLMLPVLSGAEGMESIPLQFEAMGITIYTLDDTLPKGYTSVNLVAVSGSDLYSVIRDISTEAWKIKGNAVIILSVEKNGSEIFVFAKVIKTN